MAPHPQFGPLRSTQLQLVQAPEPPTSIWALPYLPPSPCLAHGDHSWHQAAQGVRSTARQETPSPTLDSARFLHPLPYAGARFLARGSSHLPSCPGGQPDLGGRGKNFSVTSWAWPGKGSSGPGWGGEKGKESEEGGDSAVSPLLRAAPGFTAGKAGRTRSGPVRGWTRRTALGDWSRGWLKGGARLGLRASEMLRGSATLGKCLSLSGHQLP